MIRCGNRFLGFIGPGSFHELISVFDYDHPVVECDALCSYVYLCTFECAIALRPLRADRITYKPRTILPML